MSHPAPQADRSPRPLRPGQFTMRAFFVAALFVSLAFASAEIVGLAFAAALAAWAGLGAMYLRLRAWGPLVALCVIPAIHIVPWTIAVLVAGRHLAPAPLAVLVLFPWWFAVGLSLIVGAVGGMTPQASRRPDGSPYVPARPRRVPLQFRRTFYRFRWALVLASTHTAVCFVVLLVLVSGGEKLQEIGLAALAALDLPIVPLYALIVILIGEDLLDRRYWLTWMPAIWLTVMCTTLGGIFYAVVGWLVGYAVDRAHGRRQAADGRRRPQTG
jgi:hypothetical protein